MGDISSFGTLSHALTRDSSRGEVLRLRFVYKTAEEVQEILEKLCDILLETSSTSVDAKIIKLKIMDAEFACHQKYHPISESTMQKMKFEAERAELNMSLKKG